MLSEFQASQPGLMAMARLAVNVGYERKADINADIKIYYDGPAN